MAETSARGVTKPLLGLWLALLSLPGFGCSKAPHDEGKASQPPPSAAAAPSGPSAGTPAADPSAPPHEVEAAPEAEAKAEPEVPTFGPANLRPLSEQARESFLAGDEDEPIPVEIHYVQSNETRHDLFFPYIEDVGGAYIGVGSDQSFTMMGKARSELAFLMDIDYRVVDLHRMYDVFIRNSETPEALVARWDEANEEQSLELLGTAMSDLDEDARVRIQRGYRVARETVFRHLQRVIGRTVDGKAASWLSDPQMYEHIRSMYQTGRVRIMSGNLAGAHSIRTAAAAADALGVPVRVFYLSNAEEYFRYTSDFRANIEALPLDNQSVLLRTIYSKKWEHADLWAYQVQNLQDFHTRMQDKRNRSRNPMLRYAERDEALEKELGIEGFSRVGFAGQASSQDSEDDQQRDG